MPTSRTRMSALPVLYGLLALALASGAGWLFWMDQQTDHASPSAATTLIAPPQKPEAHLEETHGKEGSHASEKAASDHAEVKEESHEPSHKDPSHDESQHKAEEKTSPDTDHTNVTEAPQANHGESAEIPDAHSTEPADKSPATAHQDEAVLENTQSPHVTAPVVESEAKTDHTEPVTEQAPAAPKPAVVPEGEPTPKDVAALPDPIPPLAAVPDPDLTKNSDYGLLPVIGPTGKLPWRIYSRPFDDPMDRPRIAIIMSEMGMSKTATKSAIQNLPGPVTLSFNPYARDLQSWIELARAAGHEVLLQLPMEPFGYPKNDPGPQSLLTSLTDRENLKRLDWMLGRFAGYTGVTNQMGSKFTSSAGDISPILDVIKSRGLLFLDSRTSAKSVAGQVAAATGVPVAINNRFLDHKADRATIDSRLKDLERIARYTGTAVGVGYPYPVTLERISLWARTLARKGFVLVPVSAAINRQEIR